MAVAIIVAVLAITRWVATAAVDAGSALEIKGVEAPAKDSDSDSNATTPESSTKPSKPSSGSDDDNAGKVDFERDASIARLVADLLQHEHYLHLPMDLEISKRWLKNYVQSLDSLHFFFLQSDIDEFQAKYASPGDGNNLCGLLIQGDDDSAAVSPAFDIRKRFLDRLKEATSLAKSTLKEKFNFRENDSYPIHSEKSNWFKDKAEFETFWRGHVKEDLLQTILDRVRKSKADLTDADLTVPQETIDKLDRSYDSLLTNNVEDHEETDTVHDYLDALCHSYDPHTDYFPPEAAKEFQQVTLDLFIVGIGAQLNSIDGYPTVEEVVPGGPADQDKRLQGGDRIVAVGQGPSGETVDTTNMPINKVVTLIRGKKGSIVKLVVVPAGANTSVRKEILIKRDKVVLKDQEAKADIIEHKQADGSIFRVGVVKLPGFYSDTGDHVKKLLENMQEKYKIDGVILDLRTDGGGLLEQALRLTGLFTHHEPVVQVRDSSNSVDALYTEGPEVWSGPLIVMVNRYSASASEIVAGALQDYGRALVVGDKSTHGKGTVQTIVNLNLMRPLGFTGDPGKLKLTVQKFYRVAGGSTQQKGVIPDIILPSRLDAFPLGETELPYCLQYDTIEPMHFTNYNQVIPYVDELKKNSVLRVAKSADFDYLKNDVDYYKMRLNETARTLNIDERLKEQNDLRALWAKESADLKARKSEQDNVLEWTLEEIDHDQPPGPPEKKHFFSEDDETEAADPNSDPTFDPQMEETVSIMSDYVKLLNSNSATAQVNPSNQSTPVAVAQPTQSPTSSAPPTHKKSE